MLSRRTAYRCSLALLLGVLALALAPVAGAATPPSLESPAGGADFDEGDSIEFEWSGALQGDPDTISAQSYFRIEIAKKDDVDGLATQDPWPNTVNYTITDAGVADTRETLGAPVAGSYRWRVCAWGVVDDQVENRVEQLPGGCSSSRSLQVAEAPADSGSSTPGTVRVDGEHRTVQGEPTVRRVEVDNGTTQPAPPTKKVTLPLRDDQKVRSNVEAINASFGSGSDSAVGLSEDGLDGGSDADGAGAFGAIGQGLNSSIPGVPVPFWSLLLLGMAIPFVSWWGRSLMAMFEWPGEPEGDLDNTLLPEAVKPEADGADGATTHDHAAGGRLAA